MNNLTNPVSPVLLAVELAIFVTGAAGDLASTYRHETLSLLGSRVSRISSANDNKHAVGNLRLQKGELLDGHRVE